MTDWVVNDLPLHVLIVHLTVVFVPLAAIALVLSAVWPAARRRLGVVTPALALFAVILVPITVAAGEWLQTRVANTPLLQHHVDLGNTLLPWTIGVLIVAIAVYAWYRWRPRRLGSGARMTAGILLGVAAVAVAVGAVVTVFLTGESGAAAVWTNEF